MRVASLEWADPTRTATAIRDSVARITRFPDVAPIADRIAREGDAAIKQLTEEHDAIDRPPSSLRVSGDEVEDAFRGLSAEVRAAMEAASGNIRRVAEAQIDSQPRSIALPDGQVVSIRELAVGSAGIYAPGGRAAYPSSVLMCAIPARVAGVRRIALASPPGPDGRVARPVLAAAALCGVDEVYAMGGAQAIFALAYGTETITQVDVVAGPGNLWVQEAKRVVYGRVGIDSYAGPSELMVVAGSKTESRWAALDICSQAEHGEGSVLVAASTNAEVLSTIADETRRIGDQFEDIDPGALLTTVHVASAEDAIALANALAPEHLQLFDEGAAALADRVTTAGCVFVGPYSATAFGDYVAGSNHVLPTGGAGRFSGPLGPDVFRRKIATVEVSAEAAAKLAPHVKTLAEAEGFPVHGESAMIRTR